MFSRFRAFVVATIVLVGMEWTSAPVQARHVPRHAYRPAYSNPYYYGYAYGPYLYYNGLPFGRGWTNIGSYNTPLPCGYSGFLSEQSGYSLETSDTYIGN